MCKIIAIANQKGGVGKTTTTSNLGIGLAKQGKRVLLIDADAQGSLTASLGFTEPDKLEETLATVMANIINDVEMEDDYGILRHEEGIDLMPGNIELSGLEVSLVNVMSRELVMRSYIEQVKERYDYILIDCMPSLGMITINAFASADSILIPVQAAYLPVKGLEQLIKTIGKVKRQINPKLSIEGILLTMVDSRTNYAKDISALLIENYGSKVKIFENSIPISVRAAEISAEGGYEIIAGHRRKHGCEIAGLSTMPMFIRDYNDDEATVIMVDTNIQREDILPSEKARAYSMKYEAMKHQGKKGSGSSLDEVGEAAGESGKTVQRYIWLARLSDELLDMVDQKKIGLVQGVDISFLTEQAQEWVQVVLEETGASVSTAQSSKLKEYGKNGELTLPMVRLILTEEKPKERKVTIKADKISRYFTEDYSSEDIENIIYQLLEEWNTGKASNKQ